MNNLGFASLPLESQSFFLSYVYTIDQTSFFWEQIKLL